MMRAESKILTDALARVFEERKANKDRWIELAIHAAITDPEWFIKWQSDSADTDAVITQIMKKAIEECE